MFKQQAMTPGKVLIRTFRASAHTTAFFRVHSSRSHFDFRGQTLGVKRIQTLRGTLGGVRIQLFAIPEPPPEEAPGTGSLARTHGVKRRLVGGANQRPSQTRVAF